MGDEDLVRFVSKLKSFEVSTTITGKILVGREEKIIKKISIKV